MTKRKTGDHPDLKMVNPNAAAIDIGSTMHMAAVNPDTDTMPVRAFGTFIQDLHDLAAWLLTRGVTSVAMESTGVYWIPAFEILEAHGFEVILVNARYAKNVPGRKTDVSDASWLRQLHSYGLLRGSFRPEAEIATLRAYMRQRERLTEYAAAHIQHMQKALMEMNLQLHHVVSDITGATGMKIICAIVGGERNPEVLAAFRDVRCKASIETIKAALVGNDRAEHVFALTQSLELYDFYKAQIEACDRKLEVAVAALTVRAGADLAPLPKARIKGKQHNAPSFDVRAALYGVLGTDLTQIHGLGPSLALKLVAECGTDLRAWLGLAVPSYCARYGLGGRYHLHQDPRGLAISVGRDLFSRRVVGWAAQPRITTDLALQVLFAAIWRRKPKHRVMIHPDQGSQFTSREWQTFLRQHNLEASMSRRGNCHDNAVAESFFHLLKQEWIRRRTYCTRYAARQDVRGLKHECTRSHAQKVRKSLRRRGHPNMHADRRAALNTD